MTTPAVRSIEAKAVLMDRLTKPEYQKYMQRFQRSFYEKDSGPVITDEQGRPSGFHFCNRERMRLNMAEAYFVSAEMMPLVNWAAAGLDDTDHYQRDLWPTDYGFLYFEDGLLGKEIWGRTTVTRAISWGRVGAGMLDDAGNNVGAGTLLVFYTDITDKRDEVNADVYDKQEAQNMGDLHVHHIAFVSEEARVGSAIVNIKEQLGGDEAADAYMKYAVGDMMLTDTAPNKNRWLLALLMLLNQTVTSVERHEADRQTAKRFKRMNLPSKYTVVRLRRHANANRQEGETLVQWTHRWVVRGHWRNQPYKDGDGSTAYKRIWISPFIKGPDDAPLKQSEKVYALVR